MSTFNFTRFCQALKCQFMTSYKDWMVVFAIYIFALTFINVFSVRVSVFDGLSYAEAIEKYGEAYMMEAYPLLIKGVAIFDIMFFGIAMLFCSSFFLSHLKKTPWRSAYFMWPVSNLEKFIISLLLYVVLSGICTVVCMMIADVLRVLIDAISGRVIFWAVPNAQFGRWASYTPFLLRNAADSVCLYSGGCVVQSSEVHIDFILCHRPRVYYDKR